MPAVTLTLSLRNKQTIQTNIELPADEQPKAYAVFIHCFEDAATAGCVVGSLTQCGFGVIQLVPLRERKKHKLISPEELIDAVNSLAAQHKKVSLIIGHSLAGTTALLAAHEIASLQALVTIGTPIAPAQILAMRHKNSQGKDGSLALSLGKQEWLLPNGWMDALQEVYATKALKKIRKPILIMHAVADQTVPIDNAADVFQHMLHPKSFITLDEADHFLCAEKDMQYAGNTIATWVARYIPTYAQSELTSDKQVVTQTRETFTTHIVADQHTLVADEPKSAGGLDLGPDPYDLLAASLGACTGMTLRMYADQKKWPLEEVRVHLQHQKIYAEDCSECNDEKNKIDHIERIIEIEGPLDEKQIKRLVEIANKCPVHKTLTSGPKIVTTYREKKINL